MMGLTTQLCATSSSLDTRSAFPILPRPNIKTELHIFRRLTSNSDGKGHKRDENLVPFDFGRMPTYGCSIQSPRSSPS